MNNNMQYYDLLGYTVDTSEDDIDDFKPPRYSDAGWIIVHVTTLHGEYDPYTGKQLYEYDVLDYDHNSCVFWINEGIGIDHFLSNYVEFPRGGLYIIENIEGEYTKGTWGFDDDDEDWTCDPPRQVKRSTALARIKEAMT